MNFIEERLLPLKLKLKELGYRASIHTTSNSSGEVVTGSVSVRMHWLGGKNGTIWGKFRLASVYLSEFKLTIETTPIDVIEGDQAAAHRWFTQRIRELYKIAEELLPIE